MKILRRAYLKRGIAGIMILVMGLILVNNALFMHVHILPNGKICAHAHPFNRDAESVPGAGHQHSQADFNMYQGLQILFLLSLVALVLYKTGISGMWRLRVSEGRRFAVLPALPGRAPPLVRA